MKLAIFYFFFFFYLKSGNPIGLKLMIFPLSHFRRHFTTLNDSKKSSLTQPPKLSSDMKLDMRWSFSLTLTALVGRGKWELLIKGQSLH